MPRPTILLDLDCTLADFLAGLAAAHGVAGGAAALYRWQPRGVYDYTRSLGSAVYQPGCRTCGGRGYRDVMEPPHPDNGYGPWAGGVPARRDCYACKDAGRDMTAEAFWAPLNAAGAAFWAGLAPLPWADELLDLTRRLTDDWYVVTAPSRCPGCVPGKQAWLDRLVGGGYCDRLIPTRHKWLLARPGAWLIDDADANCETFEKDPRTGRPTGGRAVVLPAHHNSRHHRADDPMPGVRARLEMLR